MLQDDYIKQCFINASKKKKNRNDVREVLENLDEHTELLKKMLTEELFIPDYHKPVSYTHLTLPTKRIV